MVALMVALIESFLYRMSSLCRQKKLRHCRGKIAERWRCAASNKAVFPFWGVTQLIYSMFAVHNMLCVWCMRVLLRNASSDSFLDRRRVVARWGAILVSKPETHEQVWTTQKIQLRREAQGSSLQQHKKWFILLDQWLLCSNCLIRSCLSSKRSLCGFAFTPPVVCVTVNNIFSRSKLTNHGNRKLARREMIENRFRNYAQLS